MAKTLEHDTTCAACGRKILVGVTGEIDPATGILRKIPLDAEAQVYRLVGPAGDRTATRVDEHHVLHACAETWPETREGA